MKFVCLGYFDDKKWEAMSETEQKTFIDECFAYDDVLRKGADTLPEARRWSLLATRPLCG
jgi:hypothetical protein